MTTGERTAIEGHPLLLFDGLCGMCHGTVRFLMRRDPSRRLRYVPLESSLGREILSKSGICQPCNRLKSLDGIVLIESALTPGQSVTIRSDAAIRTLLLLDGAAPFAGQLLALVPRWVREAAYGFIARWRYTFFSAYKFCPLPSPQESELILGAGLQQID